VLCLKKDSGQKGVNIKTIDDVQEKKKKLAHYLKSVQIRLGGILWWKK